MGNDSSYTAIFAKTTTECMNLLANELIKNKDDKILTTRMEHHANDLPWRYSATVEYVDVDKIGRICFDNIDDRLGIIVFNIDGEDYKTIVKKFADEMAITLRTGKFCAHPYVNRLMSVSDETACYNAYNNKPTNGMLRISLGLYNTIEEAKTFIAYTKYLVSTL